MDTMANPSTALLFYARASAVYLHSKPAVFFFGLCWVAVFANYLIDAVNAVRSFGHIPGTQMCNVIRKEGHGISFVTIAVYDTIIYLAISWRLSSLSRAGDHWRVRIVSLATGKGLYSVSKGMLHEGQLYYFTTVPLTIAIAVLSQGTNAYLAIQFLPLGIAIPAIMACRLFREVRRSVPATPALSSIVFATNAHGVPEESTREDAMQAEFEMHSRADRTPGPPTKPCQV
ncbi:hypothetical protein HWV62_2221 [Athelia sp. TMB]|nr:hypothetical protein HWV62_6051 [Athelia sp. TMB]KAF7985674.1 hypothetical protein HWV62_2221 [Athelia sp. TMB]